MGLPLVPPLLELVNVPTQDMIVNHHLPENSHSITFIRPQNLLSPIIYKGHTRRTPICYANLNLRVREERVHLQTRLQYLLPRTLIRHTPNSPMAGRIHQSETLENSAQCPPQCPPFLPRPRPLRRQPTLPDRASAAQCRAHSPRFAPTQPSLLLLTIAVSQCPSHTAKGIHLPLMSHRP